MSSALRSRSLTVLLAALTITACQTTPSLQPPAVSLRLIESQPLVLPDACQATGSVIVDFTVRRDGATDNIRSAAAPQCVQQALMAWVSLCACDCGYAGQRRMAAGRSPQRFLNP